MRIVCSIVLCVSWRTLVTTWSDSLQVPMLIWVICRCQEQNFLVLSGQRSHSHTIVELYSFCIIKWVILLLQQSTVSPSPHTCIYLPPHRFGFQSFSMSLSFRPSVAGFQRHLLDPLMRFHYTLKNLGLQEVEYVLMKAIALFSPGKTRSGRENEKDEENKWTSLKGG